MCSFITNLDCFKNKYLKPNSKKKTSEIIEGKLILTLII